MLHFFFHFFYFSLTLVCSDKFVPDELAVLPGGSGCATRAVTEPEVARARSTARKITMASTEHQALQQIRLIQPASSRPAWVICLNTAPQHRILLLAIKLVHRVAE